MNLLLDERFSKGFKLKGLNSLRDGHEPIKLFCIGEQKPDWFLCQWNSKFNLIQGKFVKENDGYVIYDESKSLQVKEEGKSLVFDLKASREYDKPRTQDQPWPHLLIEQEITQNNSVKNLKQIVCDAKFKLLSFNDYMGAEKRDYHTAQFVWVVTLKDSNPLSPSYNSFIWVVMCPFDSRYEYAPLFTKQDMAMPDGEFIYSFCGRDFLDKPMKLGEEVRIKINLYDKLPMILACAQKNGFMQGSRIEDLVISSTNMGFEITGTFDCCVSVRDLAIDIG